MLYACWDFPCCCYCCCWIRKWISKPIKPHVSPHRSYYFLSCALWWYIFKFVVCFVVWVVSLPFAICVGFGGFHAIHSNCIIHFDLDVLLGYSISLVTQYARTHTTATTTTATTNLVGSKHFFKKNCALIQLEAIYQNVQSKNVNETTMEHLDRARILCSAFSLIIFNNNWSLRNKTVD